MVAAFDLHSLNPVTASLANERRASARSCLYILVDAHDGKEPMWACDISFGGMQCRASTPRWPGTYLDVSFSLPDTREAIEVGAQVIALGQAADGALTLGLRFCRISARAQMAIYRFLDRRRPLWYATAQAEPPAREQRRRENPALAALLRQERPFAALLSEAHRTLRETQPCPSAHDPEQASLLRCLHRLVNA